MCHGNQQLFSHKEQGNNFLHIVQYNWRSVSLFSWKSSQMRTCSQRYYWISNVHQKFYVFMIIEYQLTTHSFIISQECASVSSSSISSPPQHSSPYFQYLFSHHNLGRKHIKVRLTSQLKTSPTRARTEIHQGKRWYSLLLRKEIKRSLVPSRNEHQERNRII